MRLQPQCSSIEMFGRSMTLNHRTRSWRPCLLGRPINYADNIWLPNRGAAGRAEIAPWTTKILKEGIIPIIYLRKNGEDVYACNSNVIVLYEQVKGGIAHLAQPRALNAQCRFHESV